MNKICTICKNDLPLSSFYKKKGGLHGCQAECKECNKSRVKANYNKNREVRVSQKRKYNSENRDIILGRLKVYYIKNKSKILEDKKIYSSVNKEKIRSRGRSYEKKKMEDPIYRAIRNCRNRISKICRGVELIKSKSKYLGCSSEYFRKYIEERFIHGMSWDNYGTVWHVDHKKPLSLFDLSIEDNRVIAFHYTNTQPMFAKENIAKGNKRIDV